MIDSGDSDSALYIVHPLAIEEDCCARDLAVPKHAKNEHLCRAILRQVLLVLVYLHAHDLVWYDVRGSNIFIEKSGQVRLILINSNHPRSKFS